MIGIAISPSAFAGIGAMLLGNVGFENKHAPNGDHFVWLPRDVLARLNDLREPGDSCSDAILRVVKELGVGR
jgi:hypothetical protein